jgi:hypothetical protein
VSAVTTKAMPEPAQLGVCPTHPSNEGSCIVQAARQLSPAARYRSLIGGSGPAASASLQSRSGSTTSLDMGLPLWRGRTSRSARLCGVQESADFRTIRRICQTVSHARGRGFETSRAHPRRPSKFYGLPGR